MENFSNISIIIPTLNSEKTLKDCLDSIAKQDYPKDLVEIIIADGGSTDQTLDIVSEFSVASGLQPQSICLQPPTLNIQVVPNPLKTGEAGKAAGLKNARNDIVAFIDSDNILPDKDWLKNMVEPFNDPGIVASEPIEYTYRANDGYITRYCALLGMNDPLCLFLGNYDRYCTLTGRWTEMPHKDEDKGGYLKIELDKMRLPTIGANGFFIRRSALLSVFASNLKPLTSNTPASNLQPRTSNISYPDYLFDIDIISELLNSTNNIRFAKVKTGVIHIFSGNIRTFARKQRRRVRDYLYYTQLGVRWYPWKKLNKTGLARFILSCLFLFPLIFQGVEGYIKKPDIAWFFHPIACWITLWEYGWERIGGIVGAMELTREGWRQ